MALPRREDPPTARDIYLTLSLEFASGYDSFAMRDVYSAFVSEVDPITQAPVAPHKPMVANFNPAAKPTVPAPQLVPGIPTAKIYPVTIREGIRCLAGDFKLKSTGPQRPTLLATSGANGTWNGIEGLEYGQRATVTPGSGYSTAVMAGGYGFAVPENATIVGIRVVVKRKRL